MAVARPAWEREEDGVWRLLVSSRAADGVWQRLPSGPAVRRAAGGGWEYTTGGEVWWQDAALTLDTAMLKAQGVTS